MWGLSSFGSSLAGGHEALRDALAPVFARRPTDIGAVEEFMREHEVTWGARELEAPGVEDFRGAAKMVRQSAPILGGGGLGCPGNPSRGLPCDGRRRRPPGGIQ